MPLNDCILTLSELCEFLKVSDQTVLNWAEKGMPREERGKYSLVKCAQWRLERLAEELDIAKNSGDEKLHSLKVEGQKISNKERSVRLRKMLGQLVDFEAARLAWLNETTIFRKNLQAAIFKLHSSLQGVTDRNRQLEIITREIKEVQNMIGDLKIDNSTSFDELDGEFNSEESND